MRSYRFSSRTRWPGALNELTTALENRRRKGLPVLNLIESNPTRCGFDYPEDLILSALNKPEALQYEPDPKGLVSARQAVSLYYSERGLRVDSGRIVLSASTSEAYSFLFKLLADPQDVILVPRPSYPLFDYLCALADVRMQTYPLVYDQSWHVDLNELERVVCNATKAVVLVHPNNPTGSFVRPEEWSRIADLGKGRGIALICDEVFSDYGFDGENDLMASPTGSSEALTFALNGLSKVAALPQMKLGWIAVNGPERHVTEALRRMEIIADTYLSVNTPVQAALPELLSHRRLIQAQIRSRTHLNLGVLQNLIAKHPSCELLKSEGGWYSILRVPAVMDDEAWAVSLLGSGVLVHPGHFYQFDREGHLVLSLIVKSEVFQEGLERLFQHVEEAL